MEKHIILLNGSSSAGKSTLAKALQALIENKRNERYEIVSIDDFLKMTSEDVIYEDDVFEISGPLCEKVMQVFNANQGVIIDHVITSERIFNQLEENVSHNRLWMIRVTCPLEIIQKREQERKDRCLGSAETSYTYLYPREGYDLTVDTHFMTISECANRIFDKIL
ncbi:MAG: AAA family ATPase [Lachnospiraceae bacterium]|nr:AAA family ATPase [Lachnospiraceae bacterium]